MRLVLLVLFSIGNIVAAAAATDAPPGAGTAAAPADATRFHVAERHCRFVRDDWRAFLFDDTATIGVQLVAMPGRDTCGLLEWRRAGDGDFRGLEDPNAEEDIPLDYNCSTAARLLWMDQGTQHESAIPSASFVAGARAIVDARSGESLLLVGMAAPNRCGITESVLLSWNDRGADAPLQPVAADTETGRAHAALCPGVFARDVCTPSEEGYPFVGTFIAEHWSDEKVAFEAALLAYDTSALATLRKRGLPVIWVSEGIRNVSSDTTSSLAEQRRRIAWLFRDTRLADVVVADVVVGLLPWLPAEDWTPVIRAHADDTTMLRFIRRMALREGRSDVACRVAKALGIPCTDGGRKPD